MTTVKDLFENKELMQNIIEDIEEIPEDSEVFYAVWALGCDNKADLTNDEILVGEFADPDVAIDCAKKTTFDAITELGYGPRDPNTVYFSVDVETVVGDPEDEDGGTMNIGTIYHRDLWIDGEYGADADAPDILEPIVAVSQDDYELLEDGTLKISTNSLNGFDVADTIRIQFLGEPFDSLLTYVITSKVGYKDGDYFHCEFVN